VNQLMLPGTDQEVLQTAVNWLTSQPDRPVALVTVAQTWGSSPRPLGSLLVMRADGAHVGSVSGGCVEEDLLARYRNAELGEGYPTRVSYGVNRQDALRFGLPCGGRLELVVEQLESAAPLRLLLQKMQVGELVLRRVCLNTGEVSLHHAHAHSPFEYNGDYLAKVYGPGWEMLLIGAGHLSRCVAQMALMLDYRVSVCDPRVENPYAWDMTGVKSLQCMPDDAVRDVIRHNRSAVLALTHDPKLDDMALMEALTSQAFYVGALGSKRNNDQRRQRLMELGVTLEQLARLHAPIGLPIGSHTPAEIAVSITAEITALRHNAPIALNGR
jgi:xanthine dehydrogenase accessory factor